MTRRSDGIGANGCSPCCALPQTEVGAGSLAPQTRDPAGRHGRGSAAGGRRFILKVLQFYQRAPGTPGRTTQQDIAIACEFAERGFSFETVRLGIALAVVRRRMRDRDARALQPIRSLAYFVPSIAEAVDLEEGYGEYILGKFRELRSR